MEYLFKEVAGYTIFVAVSLFSQRSSYILSHFLKVSWTSMQTQLDIWLITVTLPLAHLPTAITILTVQRYQSFLMHLLIGW